MKRYILVIFALLSFFAVRAQGELGAHFLRGTWQAFNTNPAFAPEGKWSVRLPDVYNNIYISSVTYDDILGKDENGNTFLDTEKAISLLDPQNIIREQLEYGTIGFGAQLGRVHLSLQHQLRYTAYLDYPKTLAQMIWQGNGQFLGQQVDVSTDAQVAGFHEIALGAAVQIGESLTLGGRVKWLSGIADISTERNKLLIYTDTTAYALELDADLLINSSGSIDYNGFRDLSVTFDFGRFDMSRVFSRNYGVAFDLGAQLDLGKLQLAASVLDIGNIYWKGDVSNYALDGIYEFDGLDIGEGILDDSQEFGSVIDSLEAIFEVTETNEPYTFNLPVRSYFSAAYQLNDTWRLGALFYNEWYREKTFPAAALAANARFWPFLELGATYAWRAETFDNLGLNAVFYAGPLRVIAATDNIFSAIQVQKSHSANLRLGLSLVF